MANYATNIINPQTVGTASTTQLMKLGSTICDELGNEYIYLRQLTSSTSAAGQMVKFSSEYRATVAVGDDQGPVAFATGVVAADSYGWYQRKGWDTVLGSAAAADGEKGACVRISTSDSGRVVGGTSATALGDANVLVGATVTSDVATSTSIWLEDPIAIDET